MVTYIDEKQERLIMYDAYFLVERGKNALNVDIEILPNPDEAFVLLK